MKVEAGVVRGALAVLASVLVGLAVAQGVGQVALALIGQNGARNGVVLAGMVANLFVVPLVAGLVLGVIARRWLLQLSFISVVGSLVATFIAVGAAGLPQFAKIFTYVFQWALVYLGARFGARWPAPWPMRRRDLPS